MKLSKNVNVNTDDLNEDEDEQGTESEAPTNEADEYDMEHYNDDGTFYTLSKPFIYFDININFFTIIR